jgi:hypothetical protein
MSLEQLNCTWGAIPLLLRGIEKVAIEIDLYVQAYNFKRLLNLFDFNDLMTKVAEFDWKMALKRGIYF